MGSTPEFRPEDSNASRSAAQALSETAAGGCDSVQARRALHRIARGIEMRCAQGAPQRARSENGIPPKKCSANRPSLRGNR